MEIAGQAFVGWFNPVAWKSSNFFVEKVVVSTIDVFGHTCWNFSMPYFSS